MPEAARELQQRFDCASRLALIAGQPAVQQGLRWFSARKQWITEKQLELCRIPAPTFQEEARADWLAVQLGQLGWQTQRDAAGNLLARLGGSTGSPLLAITAHLDTVLTPAGPDAIRFQAGRLLGPGVADNGAGLAALLALAGAVAETGALGPMPPLLLVANVGEEGEGNLCGMRFLCHSRLGRAVQAYVVLDGPGVEPVTVKAIASRRLEIIIRGPGGHSWTDADLPNPIHALARTIARCEEEFRLSSGTNGRRAFHFSWIEGGTSVNSIPALARAKLDLRAEDEAGLDPMAAIVRRALEQVLTEVNRSTAVRLTGQIRQLGSRPSGELPPEAPLLQHLQAVDAYLGIRARLDAASTDANIPLALGKQAVCLGAGGRGGRAHTPEEWFDPAGRELALSRILLLVACMLNYLREQEERPARGE